MRDDQGLLGRTVVVDISDNLHSHVSFTSTGRTHDHCKARAHARTDSLRLGVEGVEGGGGGEEG